MNTSINYNALKQAEAILVDNITIPQYFLDHVVPNFKKYQKSGVNTNLLAESVLCPFHEEKEPSFSYVAKGKYYNCFSCSNSGDRHSGGNVVHLHKEIMGLLKSTSRGKVEISMVESIVSLAKLYNIIIPKIEIESAEESNILAGVQDILTSAKTYKYSACTKVSLKFLMDYRKKVNDTGKLIIDNTYALIKFETVIERGEFLEVIKPYLIEETEQ